MSIPRQKTDAYYTSRTNNTEWYTPSHIIERVRDSVGGTIDLDPFSCDEAQQTVKASHYFTAQNNALHQSWPKVNSLYANPPYSQQLMGTCIERIVMEYSVSWTHGVILTNNATDAKWFHSLLSLSTAMCIFYGRIKFLQPQGILGSQNTRGQIAFYVGEDVGDFKSAFKDLGKICLLTN